MAMEPLGSVMSVQTQTVAAPKPAAPAEKPAEYSSANVQPTVKVDATTVVVEDAQNNAQNQTSEQGTQQQASSEQVRKAVEELNRKINVNTEAVFGMHEATNRVTIKIVDKSTKEVIREFPPEKTLDMIAKVWEIAGILVDEKR